MTLIGKIEKLFQKHLNERLTDSESSEFKELLLNKENEFAIKQKLFEQLNEFENYPQDDTIDFNKHTHDFYVKIKSFKEERDKSKRFSLEFKQRQNLQKLFRIAAIFILAIGFSFMFYAYVSSKRGVVESADGGVSQFVVSAPLGAKSKIILPDGSNVFLNAGSTLRYSPNFNNSNRRLELEGEAYFDVAKNEAIPFEVVTSEISITALGTQFNVKAYGDEDVIETTLVEGKVKIRKNSQSITVKGVLLEPNQIATFVKESDEFISQDEEIEDQEEIIIPDRTEKIEIKKGEVLITEEIRPELYTSWKDIRWLLEAEELSSLAKKLERKFNIKIVFKDKGLLSYKFTGTLEDETLEQVLKAIKLTAPIDYSVDGNTVVIKEDKRHTKEFNKILK